MPSIRRLVDHRDRLLAELEAARATLRTLEEEAAAARQHHTAELEAVRGARQTLEQDTAGLLRARDENRLFITEYAYFPTSRPIEAAAGGRQIEALFRRYEPAIAATIADIARHAEALARIPRSEDGPLRPYWHNNWFPPFDGAALYGLIAEQRPCRYVEVGSGISTRFARQAITDLGLPTRIVSIDPASAQRRG